MVPFAGWEMPVQYEGVSAEHLAVRSGCGVFDVSHMGEIETEGPGALGLLQRLLSNDVAKLDVGGAQYSVLCREDGGVLDDLFTYRLGGDRYLTVTNAANHERDLAWFRDHAGRVRLRGPRPTRRLGDAGGPRARRARDRRPPSPRASCRRGCTPRRRRRRRGVPGLRHRLHRRGRGRDPLPARARADALGRARSTRGAVPAGLGARDTLRLEVCFHLYGNDLSEDRNPIEAGLGWCCKEETGFIGSEAIAAARAEGTAQKLAPFVITERGIPRQGNAVIGPDGGEAGVVTSGTHSPSLERGIGMAYVDAPLAEPGTEVEIDVRGKRRAARIESKPLYTAGPRGGELAVEESYPEELKYHPEHDWARIEGDEATFGITWYAQDSLGEVVFFEPPEVGATVSKDSTYAEVESVKAVSDVYSPLSGEVTAVNDALAENPERINEDPYGEGWLVKVKLSDPSEAGCPDGRRGVPGAPRRRLASAALTEPGNRQAEQEPRAGPDQQHDEDPGTFRGRDVGDDLHSP